jgi:hypothetical protein
MKREKGLLVLLVHFYNNIMQKHKSTEVATGLDISCPSQSANIKLASEAAIS